MSKCVICKKGSHTRQTALIKHIDTKHPFASIGSNHIQLNLAQRIYLLQQLAIYSDIISLSTTLEDIDDAVRSYLEWDGISLCSTYTKFVWASHMLLPAKYAAFIETRLRPISLNQSLPPNNPQIFYNINDSDIPLLKELHTITTNHLAFCKRITPVLDTITGSSSNISTVFEEFNRFLNLGFYWDGTNFCPSLFIDLIWHCAMMNSAAYNSLCSTFFSKILDHCLPENEGEEEKRDAIFFKQFVYFHGRPPLTTLNKQTSENGIAILAEKYQQQSIYLEEEKKRKDNERQEADLKLANERQEQINLQKEHREEATLAQIERERIATIKREVDLKLAIQQATDNKAEYEEMIKDNPKLLQEWKDTQNRGDYYFHRNGDLKLEVLFHEPIRYRGCTC